MKWSTKGIQMFQNMGRFLLVPAPRSKEINEIDQYQEYTIEIKKKYAKRSLDANAYAWVLCQKLGEKLRITKEEVYRHAIKDSGAFTIVPIQDQAIERYIEIWQGHGIGWIAEVFSKCKTEGYSNVICYHGSSVYDTKEMAHLIDYLVHECQEQGITTYTNSQIESLLKEWNDGQMAQKK